MKWIENLKSKFRRADYAPALREVMYRYFFTQEMPAKTNRDKIEEYVAKTMKAITYCDQIIDDAKERFKYDFKEGHIECAKLAAGKIAICKRTREKLLLEKLNYEGVFYGSTSRSSTKKELYEASRTLSGDEKCEREEIESEKDRVFSELVVEMEARKAGDVCV